MQDVSIAIQRVRLQHTPGKCSTSGFVSCVTACFSTSRICSSSAASTGGVVACMLKAWNASRSSDALLHCTTNRNTRTYGTMF